MLEELKQIFHGPMIRQMAGIRDMGELVLAYFSDPDGAPIYHIDDDRKDIWVTLRDAIHPDATGKIVARLFAPMNMLWRLPKQDESGMVARGSEAAAPGSSYALYGDGGKENQVPDWLDDDNAGISVDETVHIESKSGDIFLKAASGKTIKAEVNGATIEIDASGNITLTAKSPNGVATITATPVTGKVALGPVASLSVLVMGSMDSLGVPITQAPAAALTIVKGG